MLRLARALTPALLALSCVSSLGCSSSNEETSSSEPAPPLALSGTYELRSDVPRLDAAKWDDIVVAHDGPELWLRPSAREVLALTPGAVTVIPKRGVLKVAGVVEEGAHLVVERGSIGFGDFLERGDFEVSGRAVYDTPFVDQGSDVGAITPKSIETDVYGKAGSKALIDGAREMVLDGWGVQKHVVAKGDDVLGYDITLQKTSGVFDAKIDLRGTVSGLRTTLKVAVHDHVTDTQTFDVKVAGDAELTWAVRIHQGGHGYNKIVAPGLSYKQQIWLGDIPLVLKVKSSVAVILGASGAKTVTTGKVALTYSSDSGIGTHGGPGGGGGEVRNEAQQGTVATAPAAFGFVATLPRVELGVGVADLFVVGTSFTNISNTVVTAQGAVAGSPCAELETKLTGKLGLAVDAGSSLTSKVAAAGVSIAGDLASRTLYETKRNDRTCGFSGGE